MRQSGQYWIKIKWPAAVNGYTWVVGSWYSSNNTWRIATYRETLANDQLLEVDENRLTYIESQNRTKQYDWPKDTEFNDDDFSALSVCKSLKNIGEILQDIHQQLVISNQKQ